MVAKMNSLRFWTSCTDERYIVEISKQSLIKSGFNIRNYCDEKFEPFGFTCLFLLSESHFAIHTFPEVGKSYCELSSCVDVPFLNFINSLNNFIDVEIIKESR